MAPREAKSVAVSNPAAAEAEVELSLGLSVGGGVGGAAASGDGAAAAENRAAMETAAARSRARDRAGREAEPISGVRRSAATAAPFAHTGFLPNPNPNPNAPGPYLFSYPHPHPHPHPHPYQQVQYMPVPNGFRFQYVAPWWSPAAAPAPPEGAAAGVGNAVNLSAGEGRCAAASPVNSPRSGSSSSGVSDRQSGSVRGSSDWSHSRSNSGTSLTTEKQNSSASQSSLMKGSNANTTATTANAPPANGNKPVPGSRDNEQEEDPILPRMPCVTTTGNGPNGRTVTGFLYRYTKSEIRILCVCHGKSFSPAEFVEHAGATDVEHPLRRIVVVPSN